MGRQGATASGLTLCLVLLCCQCHSLPICEGVEDDTPLHLLSTKTGYFNAHKDGSHWEKYSEAVRGCSAKQVWLLARHGTRFPTANDMGHLVKLLPPLSQRIRDNHRHDRGCLKERDVSQLTDWFPPFELRDREQLQEMGHDEMASIGTHWREFLPDLFDVDFDSSLFKIDFTVKNRTEQSAYHFLRGMFGEDTVGNIELPKAYSPNFILRFYKACPRWLQEVYKNNETTYKERWLFTETEHFKKMVHAVSARLGFMHPLSTDEVVAMYDECRYEAAWWPQRKSAWCSAFSHYDFEVMEYHQDLKYYYEDSFGHPMNGKTACQTLNDIRKLFQHAVQKDGEVKPRGVFYFAHDKTVFKVMASLGLFRPPQHLRHDNFEDMRNRVWRTSFISPFAANLAFVLYKCEPEYKVALFFQGEPVPIGEACQRTVCAWEEFQRWLKENHLSCDLNALCMLKDEL
ncbi:multiple inositol polyphosphate phosphatase 1-like isoform X1 [Portunus trituberculatus]|nr:multiple inositol polyphosphate phosphatase 1-like isoform X1 [Portunus trituberculatus]XP_045133297.1 multiple inositol polyphosphate phosphatase 1-like isoform X1 [Portunus trituberculatus]